MQTIENGPEISSEIEAVSYEQKNWW